MADPATGVQTLWAVVQELNKRLEARPPPKSTKVDIGTLKALQKENTQLRLENSNMYFLKTENDSLKDQLADAVAAACGGGPGAAVGSRRPTERPMTAGGVRAKLVESLEGELASMRSEVENLRQVNKDLANNSQAIDLRPCTPADVLRAADEYDAELADLFRRNEQGLREARSSLTMAKAELGINEDSGSQGRGV
jgi:hypothetical protein